MAYNQKTLALRQHQLELRCRVNNNLIRWERPTATHSDQYTFIRYLALRRLLGYKNPIDDYAWSRDFTDKDQTMLEALDGPNGYVIYRMLKARNCK